MLVCFCAFLGISFAALSLAAAGSLTSQPSQPNQYIVMAWNDLGMHCYNRNFQDLGVLPPFNTLRAQVFKVGNPPQIITTGITVTYVFTDNNYSVGKSNFWEYEDGLFGVNLPDNIGLAGKGLSGTLDLQGNLFEATGIPLTEFRDSAPSSPYPYQLATIVVQDKSNGQEVARVISVAPVSTEMHCDYCHSDYGKANPNLHTGRVETNILTLHDRENETHLMDDRPVLCADCHESNALGKPGLPGYPSLSNAMHEQHADEVPASMTGCYNCHPGPQTQCLRDVMSQRGMNCINCHGNMHTVSENSDPWLNEPRCDNDACHGSRYAQDQPLYRHSSTHYGISCEACHDSPHAIAPSTQPNDAIKFLTIQGSPGPLRSCTVCHENLPDAAGPHGLLPRSQFLPWIRK